MKGLIIENSANLYKVVEIENDNINNLIVENNIYNCLARGNLKKIGINPVVGDIVEFSKEEKVIEKIEIRKNYLKRPKIANITQIVFVLSMKHPKPDLLLLDKQLAFAEKLGIRSLIVLNKSDLVKEEEIKEIENIYTSIGYNVIKTCAINDKKEDGIGLLRKKLKGEITVFAGNSGVGKSTIINALFKDKITEEGKISQKNKKGKNTTTLVRLYELENNTFIADAPGFATFDVNEIEKEELSHFFIEFIPYIKECSYVGCSHINEDIKECNVKRALEENKISKSRYENYCKIYEELKRYKKW